jgi:hypothetical protein
MLYVLDQDLNTLGFDELQLAVIELVRMFVDDNQGNQEKIAPHMRRTLMPLLEQPRFVEEASKVGLEQFSAL